MPLSTTLVTVAVFSEVTEAALFWRIVWITLPTDSSGAAFAPPHAISPKVVPLPYGVWVLVLIAPNTVALAADKFAPTVDATIFLAEVAGVPLVDAHCTVSPVA